MATPLELILTNSYKDGMISFLGAHPEYFVEAIELVITRSILRDTITRG
ncbi:MAG: hypothetical protein U9N86_15275 [Bacteroidota bacterium]|nr:hypothetical protein [Bacteroidota bacterium]